MGERLLIGIVDDDESVRAATLSLLRSLDYEAVAFGSAEEFLRSSSFDRISCLVLDVQMPGLGGLELQRHLSLMGLSIPIVFITAYPDATLRGLALGGGAAGFLPKPFREDELLEGLRLALTVRGRRRLLLPRGPIEAGFGGSPATYGHPTAGRIYEEFLRSRLHGPP